MTSIGALARRFDVDRDTIKTWSWRFSEFFSASAKQIPRAYTKSDERALAFIAYKYMSSFYDDESEIEDEICTALHSGEHHFHDFVLLNSPMFQDVPKEITEDWSHGSVLGGFGAHGNKPVIAEGYKKAGDLLLKEASQANGDTMLQLQIAYPMFFVYRHALELCIKAIIGEKSYTHDLDKLADELEQVCLNDYGFVLNGWIKERLHEFAQVDPAKATAFRYENPGGTGLEFETWIEWRQVKLIVDELYDNLEAILARPRK